LQGVETVEDRVHLGIHGDGLDGRGNGSRLQQYAAFLDPHGQQQVVGIGPGFPACPTAEPADDTPPATTLPTLVNEPRPMADMPPPTTEPASALLAKPSTATNALTPSKVNDEVAVIFRFVAVWCHASG
jgi:hypothetical protein